MYKEATQFVFFEIYNVMLSEICKDFKVIYNREINVHCIAYMLFFKKGGYRLKVAEYTRVNNIL